jgi:hypothetical protein
MQAFVTEMTVWPETEPWYPTAVVRVSLTERHAVSQVNGGKPEEAFVKTKQDMLVALCADWNRNRSHTEGHVPTFHCRISSHLPRAVELTVVFVFTVKMRHAFEPSLVYVGTQFAEDLEGNFRSYRRCSQLTTEKRNRGPIIEKVSQTWSVSLWPPDNCHS